MLIILGAVVDQVLYLAPIMQDFELLSWWTIRCQK